MSPGARANVALGQRRVRDDAEDGAEAADDVYTAVVVQHERRRVAAERDAHVQPAVRERRST